MSAETDALLGVKKPKGDEAMSADACLRVLVEESRSQTRQLKIIRLLISLAWLALIAGAIRIYSVR
jgi:hypothetical protein